MDVIPTDRETKPGHLSDSFKVCRKELVWHDWPVERQPSATCSREDCKDWTIMSGFSCLDGSKAFN
jgi:hypothetical protein